MILGSKFHAHKADAWDNSHRHMFGHGPALHVKCHFEYPRQTEKSTTRLIALHLSPRNVSK